MSVLASGSTGNATYVESDKGSILVDAGLTGKKMEELFGQIDTKFEWYLGDARAFGSY